MTTHTLLTRVLPPTATALPNATSVNDSDYTSAKSSPVLPVDSPDCPAAPLPPSTAGVVLCLVAFFVHFYSFAVYETIMTPLVPEVRLLSFFFFFIRRVSRHGSLFQRRCAIYGVRCYVCTGGATPSAAWRKRGCVLLCGSMSLQRVHIVARNRWHHAAPFS